MWNTTGRLLSAYTETRCLHGNQSESCKWLKVNQEEACKSVGSKHAAEIYL